VPSAGVDRTGQVTGRRRGAADEEPGACTTGPAAESGDAAIAAFVEDADVTGIAELACLDVWPVVPVLDILGETPGGTSTGT